MIITFSTTLYIPLVLSLVGMMVCAYIFIKKGKGHPLVCPIGSSCNDVIYSKYSKTFGIRNEIAGFLYYLFVFLVYGSIVLNANLPAEILTLLSLASFLAFVFSVYLVTMMVFVIRKLCVWCITSASISTIIFVISFLGFLN